VGALPVLAVPRLLSSHWTLFYKVGLPPLWLGLGLWLGLLGRHAGDLAAAPLGVLWLGVGAYLLWLAGALKHVRLEGDALEVRGLREALRVPLRDCEAVSGSLLLYPELVFLRLRRPTAFGSRVIFVPRQRGFHPFSRHPLVARLRELIQAHEAPGLPPPLGAQPGERPGLRAAVLGALVLVAAAGLVVTGVTALLRTENPYSLALERARNDPALIAALGEPIEPGWLLSGRLKILEEAGSAQLEIPVHGPRGSARLRVEATRRGGRWVLLELRAELDDGRRIDLLDADAGEPPGELL
jgi:hypothetical protein